MRSAEKNRGQGCNRNRPARRARRLIFIGAIRDKIGWRGLIGLVGGSNAEKVEEGFAPLLADWEEFYMRRLFLRCPLIPPTPPTYLALLRASLMCPRRWPP